MIYEVKWSIDVVADSHEQAAKMAWDLIREPNSKFTIFTVHHEQTGMTGVYDVEATSPKKIL